MITLEAIATQKLWDRLQALQEQTGLSLSELLASALENGVAHLESRLAEDEYWSEQARIYSDMLYRIDYLLPPLPRLKRNGRWGAEFVASEGPSVPTRLYRDGLASAKWTAEFLRRQGATQVRIHPEEE